MTSPLSHSLRAGALRVELSRDLSVSPQRAVAIYRDFNNWNRLFPLTIRGTRLIGEDDHQQRIEVDHKQAGKIINILTVLSRQVIQLEEFKRIFDGLFINRFEAIPAGTRYRITAYISFKGLYRLVKPFVKGIVKHRMEKFVLAPFKEYAERLRE